MALVRPIRQGVDVNRGRTVTLALVAAVLVAIGLLASSALARTGATPTSLPTLNQQVFAAINSFRTSHGLAALTDSKALDRAALAHSLQMGQRSFFSHNSANGEQFYVRVKRYYPATGYSHWTVGENLVWGAPALSAAAAMQQWIKSPPHLKNLKTAKWRDLGVSAVTVATAGGPYGGQRVTIITTDFGVRVR
jgi:uncharacterized protein YkwD